MPRGHELGAAIAAAPSSLFAGSSAGFDAVDQRFDRIETELWVQRLETKAGFESIQRLIFQVGGGIIATLAIGIFTVLAA
jgi:hypothetical protein